MKIQRRLAHVHTALHTDESLMGASLLNDMPPVISRHTSGELWCLANLRVCEAGLFVPILESLCCPISGFV